MITDLFLPRCPVINSLSVFGPYEETHKNRNQRISRNTHSYVSGQHVIRFTRKTVRCVCWGAVGGVKGLVGACGVMEVLFWDKQWALWS